MIISSRRTFLKTGAIATAGVLLSPSLTLVAYETEKFLCNIGVCTSLKNHDILSKAGFSYIEIGVQRFLVPSKPEEEFKKNLATAKKSKIPVYACNSFLPGALKITGEEASHDKVLEFAETAFKRAKVAGIKVIVLGSSRSRKVPEGFSAQKAKAQFIELCAKMAPFAKKYGVVVSLEPLNRGECNLITSLAKGAEIVKAVNHPNFRLLADIYHMRKEDESPEEIIKYGHLLHHTHVAQKKKRMAPSVNGEDFTPYFKALKKVGYKGGMSIEGRWDSLEDQAEGAYKAMRTQIERLIKKKISNRKK